ncbi:MAG: uncharacterized protein A8A55_1403 [Amphiamblys sp. WSBS2006]|nr:MAG: uncharacterized protein A8A55_1403 [Amphiamblys sp. WSBS2006]
MLLWTLLANTAMCDTQHVYIYKGSTWLLLEDAADLSLIIYNIPQEKTNVCIDGEETTYGAYTKKQTAERMKKEPTRCTLCNGLFKEKSRINVLRCAADHIVHRKCTGNNNRPLEQKRCPVCTEFFAGKCKNLRIAIGCIKKIAPSFRYSEKTNSYVYSYGLLEKNCIKNVIFFYRKQSKENTLYPLALSGIAETPLLQQMVDYAARIRHPVEITENRPFHVKEKIGIPAMSSLKIGSGIVSWDAFLDFRGEEMAALEVVGGGVRPELLLKMKEMKKIHTISVVNSAFLFLVDLIVAQTTETPHIKIFLDREHGEPYAKTTRKKAREHLNGNVLEVKKLELRGNCFFALEEIHRLTFFRWIDELEVVDDNPAITYDLLQVYVGFEAVRNKLSLCENTLFITNHFMFDKFDLEVLRVVKNSFPRRENAKKRRLDRLYTECKRAVIYGARKHIHLENSGAKLLRRFYRGRVTTEHLYVEIDDKEYPQIVDSFTVISASKKIHLVGHALSLVNYVKQPVEAPEVVLVANSAPFYSFETQTPFQHELQKILLDGATMRCLSKTTQKTPIRVKEFVGKAREMEDVLFLKPIHLVVKEKLVLHDWAVFVLHYFRNEVIALEEVSLVVSLNTVPVWGEHAPIILSRTYPSLCSNTEKKSVVFPYERSFYLVFEGRNRPRLPPRRNPNEPLGRFKHFCFCKFVSQRLSPCLQPSLHAL